MCDVPVPSLNSNSYHKINSQFPIMDNIHYPVHVNSLQTYFKQFSRNWFACVVVPQCSCKYDLEEDIVYRQCSIHISTEKKNLALCYSLTSDCENILKCV